MATLSITEASGILPQLIDRALKGEAVLITRDGLPLVALRPVSVTARPVTQVDIDWLDAHRVGARAPDQDAAAEVRSIRDEGA